MRCLPIVREGILRLFVRVRELECDAGATDQCPLEAAPSFIHATQALKKV